MLQTSHSCGDKNAEMADMRVGEVDDSLPCPLEIIGVAIDSGDPSKRLVRWRDVVAVRCKDDDWILNSPQVSSATLANLENTLLKLVADEQRLR